MHSLLVLAIAITYIFFGVITITALLFLEKEMDDLTPICFVLWPVTIIIGLLCVIAYCAYCIGKSIREWLNKKLFKDQRGQLI